MRWWWLYLAALVWGGARAQPAVPTVCAETACRCDSFTRVICNCTAEANEVTLRPDGVYRVPAHTSGIFINGCARLQFLPDTVRNLIMLRNIEIRNVANVLIGERSLAWTPFSDMENHQGINIIINNSTINEISSHAIQGRVDNIDIRNSKLKSIKPYAFSSLIGVSRIELADNEFENIEFQTFKKFTTNNFILRGGLIKTLPSRFLSDVEVTGQLRLEGVTINYMYSLTFIVSLPQTVLIQSNNIKILEGDVFHVGTRGPITFRNNTIKTVQKGAFLGFSALPEVTLVKGRQELLIDNNTMTELDTSALIYNQSTLIMRIDGLNLHSTCTCEFAERWLPVQKEQGGTINCWYSLESHFVSLSTFLNSRCGTFKQTFWIFVIIGVGIVIIVAVVVVLCIVKREREKKNKVQIVLPDGKTYRETEFHIVVERAELLTTDL